MRVLHTWWGQTRLSKEFARLFEQRCCFVVDHQVVLVSGLRALLLRRLLFVELAATHALAQCIASELSLIRYLADLIVKLRLHQSRSEELISWRHKLETRLALEPFKRVDAKFSSTRLPRAINYAIVVIVDVSFCKPSRLLRKDIMTTVLNLPLTCNRVEQNQRVSHPVVTGICHWNNCCNIEPFILRLFAIHRKIVDAASTRMIPARLNLSITLRNCVAIRLVKDVALVELDFKVSEELHAASGTTVTACGLEPVHLVCDLLAERGCTAGPLLRNDRSGTTHHTCGVISTSGDYLSLAGRDHIRHRVFGFAPPEVVVWMWSLELWDVWPSVRGEVGLTTLFYQHKLLFQLFWLSRLNLRFWLTKPWFIVLLFLLRFVGGHDVTVAFIIQVASVAMHFWNLNLVLDFWFETVMALNWLYEIIHPF